MNESDIIVDDTQTTIKVWEDWHISGYNPSELTETKDSFTKTDFEKALEKVSHKVKN
ncbi:MAG: hypothetical protein O8C64_00605 [Candidatus Methanoperedens sp.]|nr:hypothetical protein [Candidatus Methanoperedens sp.]